MRCAPRSSNGPAHLGMMDAQKDRLKMEGRETNGDALHAAKVERDTFRQPGDPAKDDL